MSAPRKESYDFVVIGGGTAGLVIAARLTENPHVSVLVLEAGQNALQDPRVAIPALWGSVLGSELDWDFLTVPQEHLNGRRIGHPQGRVLGGSSAINAEVFLPPSASGFDAWEALGNAGWGWQEVSRYFRKSHTLVTPDQDVAKHLNITWVDDSANKGTTGPIKASFTGVVQDPLGKAWVETFVNVGAGLTGDPFSGRATGGWAVPSSVDPVSKTRSYAASAYYAPVSTRSNLEVVTGAMVNKIVLDEQDSGKAELTVRGVVFKLSDGTEHQVKASREVILAAGAYQSPKLLELSGIGDKSLLDSFGIEAKVDNPNVGCNLQDHLMNGISFEVADGVMTGDCLLRQEPEFIQAFTQMYQEHKAGPFASGSVLSLAFQPIMPQVLDKLEPGLQSSLEEAIQESGAKTAGMSEFEREFFNFVKSNLETPSEASASLMLLAAQTNLHNGPKAAGLIGNPQPGNYISLGVSPLHPLSRGTSHIASADPSVPPVIDPRYLSHPLDIEVYARHLMTVEVLAKTAPLANYLKPGGRRAQPGNPRVDTLEKAKAYIRETALSNNHPVGTCAMLPRDKGGVVDARLKVYGVAGLRVVDASIMPFISRCNTQTVVYTVAEKAADLVKEDHGLI